MPAKRVFGNCIERGRGHTVYGGKMVLGVEFIYCNNMHMVNESGPDTSNTFYLTAYLRLHRK